MLHFSYTSDKWQAVALASTLALGACASSQTYYAVTGSGKSEAELRAAGAYCTALLANVPNHGAAYVECMNEHGVRVLNPGGAVSPAVAAQSGSAVPSTQNAARVASVDLTIPAPMSGFGDGLPGVLAPGPDPSRVQVPIIRAALAASRAQNYAEAMRLWRQVDAEPEVDVAFAGLPLTDISSSGGLMNFGNARFAAAYSAGLAHARLDIGSYYEYGLGVPQDYAEAARWYQKCIDTKDIHGGATLPARQAKRNLGLLYAYGLGVPQDRTRAKQIWASLDTALTPNANDLLALLDINALPQAMTDDDAFWREVSANSVPILAKQEAQRQAERAARWQPPAPSGRNSAAPPANAGDDSGPKNNCNLANVPAAMSLGWVGGMFIGNGCNW
jgi:hypothetical protein